MKHIDNNPYASHENISMLLPWYVNKTLRGAELNAVEQHLKVCLICKRELMSQQRLINRVSSTQPHKPLFPVLKIVYIRLEQSLHNPRR